MNFNYFKNKNFLILILFLFLILAPEIIQAAGFMQVCSWQEWLTFPATTFMCVLRWLFTALIKVFLMIIFLVWTIPLTFQAALLSIVISILNASLIPLLSVPVLGSPIVVEMWKFVRDFSNLFFILFFVFIGLSTILGINDYKYQKTLPPLIIMALLINFSLLFVGFIVDIGNILTGVFLQSVQGTLGSSFVGILGLHTNIILDGLSQIWSASWADPIASLVITSGLVAYVFAIIGVYSIMNLAFWTIVFIFVFRIAILWILAILSPLAFICYIFTPTKKIWQRWLSNVIKWSIVAVPILFFMFIALKVLQYSPEQFQQIASSLPTDGVTGRIAQLMTVAMTPILSVIIMSVGVVISLTALPEFADGAISASKTGKSWVQNTGAGLVRRTNTGSQLESTIMKGLESNAVGRMFVGPTGTFDQKKQKEKGGYGEIAKFMQTEDLIKTLQQLGTSPTQKAAILERLAEKGNLTSDLYETHINSATIGGADKGKILQSLPLMTGDDEEFQKTLTKLDGNSFANMNNETWVDHSSTDPNKDQKQQELLVRAASGTPGSLKGLSSKMTPDQRKAMLDAIRRNENNIKTQIDSKDPGKGDERVARIKFHLQ